MKFLIENYATYENTQALYLTKSINSMHEHEAVLWNSVSSIYDIMDKEKPDVYITSANKLSKDFAQYVNNVKKIRLLLNVDDLQQNIISSLEESIISSNIDCCFFFGSNANVKTKKIKFLQLHHAYDNNLSRQNTSIEYSIDKAIFIKSKDDIKKYDGTYHFVSNDAELNEVADLTLPENMLFVLLKNYNTVIFNNISDYIPQSFFDAIMQSTKVYHENISEETREMLYKVLKINGSLDYNDSNKIQDFSEIKKYVLEKHMPNNRVKTILSQLPKE